MNLRILNSNFRQIEDLPRTGADDADWLTTRHVCSTAVRGYVSVIRGGVADDATGLTTPVEFATLARQFFHFVSWQRVTGLLIMG